MPTLFRSEVRRHAISSTSNLSIAFASLGRSTSRPLYLGSYHVTVGQFRQFVEASGYRTEAETSGLHVQGFDPESDRLSPSEPTSHDWRKTGFDQTEDHPVVNVNWNDAMAFSTWISNKEGRKGLSVANGSRRGYACRAGTDTEFVCGDDPDQLVPVANVADLSDASERPRTWTLVFANDGYRCTSPVGQFRPNAFGLYDLHGNALPMVLRWVGP